MRMILTTVMAAGFSTVALFAGALTLQVSNPQSESQDLARNAGVIARISACTSPEKTQVTATAEGMAGGKRVSIPLRVTNLPTAGSFAVAHEWPKTGTWAIVMVATNPDYDYATSVVAPAHNNELAWGAVKHVYHRPTTGDIDAALAHNGL